MRTFFVCTILIICCLANGCFFRAYKTPTEAMSPTIKPGDGLVSDEISHKFGEDFQRFDIVVFNSPPVPWDRNQRTTFIFRIIGLQGEKVEIKKGKVYINDNLLIEPFEKIESEKGDFSPIVVPNKEYFLLGDNRPNSWDSRFWKPATIKREDIYGKIIEIKKDY